ncbi:MAG: hypothetical protein WC859_04260 [Elusimicrobiota bacterium]
MLNAWLFRRFSFYLILPLVGLTLVSHAEDGGPSSFIGGPQQTSIDYTFHHSPGSRAPQSGAAPILTGHRAHGNFVVSKSSASTWSVQQSVDHLNLTESPVVPDTGMTVPDSLWQVETGAAYNHRLGDRREWGIRGSVGSASDKPFNSLNEPTGRLTAHYQIPSRAHNAWIFALAYSNNRHFLNNIPMPMVAYSWQNPSAGFRAIIGFPFVALSYAPNDAWSSRLAVFGPRNLSLEVARRIKGPVKGYAGLDWKQMEWLRAGRDDHSNRLFLDQKKIALGLRYPLGRAYLVDLSGGQEFDRRFFEGHSASDNTPRAVMANSWFLQIILRWR